VGGGAPGPTRALLPRGGARAAPPPVASARSSWLRPRTFLAAGAALALLGLGLLAVRPAHRAPPPDPAPVTVAAPPTAAPAPSSVPSEPEEAEPLAAEPAATDDPTPPRVPGSRPRAVQGARGRCDPPYTLDAKGRKMYKRYCF